MNLHNIITACPGGQDEYDDGCAKTTFYKDFGMRNKARNVKRANFVY
jgi:hypothetical protein